MGHNLDHSVIEADVLIIGAGLIGSSVAMHLGQLGVPNVRVVDFDLDGTLSSSELNAGGVRATWNQPINILASKVSIEYMAKHAEDVGYRPCGYLWLHTSERYDFALKARDRQIALGWPVEAWNISQLKTKIPFLDKTDGIQGAIFAPQDGLVNPNLLKKHYRRLAQAAGVQFDDRVWIDSVKKTSGPASGPLSVEAVTFARILDGDQKLEIAQGKRSSVETGRVVYRASRVINCAGPWAKDLAKTLGYACPSHAVRRQVCIFDCKEVDLTPYGMIVDTSGVYFHPEATNGLAGIAHRDEPAGVNYHYDGESFFMESIWPMLYERSSGFERLRHITGWAGLYEVSPDESAIIGEVKGTNGRIFEAHSFSGHGVMHSYAAGRAMAELLTQKHYSTLDLSVLSGDRFEKGQSVTESLVI